MTYKQFKTHQLTKDLLTIFCVIAILVLSLTVCNAQNQQKQIPDTAITLKATNNQLYQLNALLSFASQQLVKTDIPVKDYAEFQKECQALLSEWFKQKQAQVKQPEKTTK